MDLFRSFTELKTTGSENEFSAIALSERRRDFLCKSSVGSPVFLLHNANSTSHSPAITLKRVDIQFNNRCRVVVGDRVFDDQFACVSCDPSEPELFELFVRCVAAAIAQLPNKAESRDLESCLHGLLKLFRSLSRPNSREITGIWAELLVISEHSDVAAALHAWHLDHLEKFDFSWLGGRMEVKATVLEQRQHDFALEQLQPPESGKGWIASFLLQPMSGGAGVMELAKRIDEIVGHDPELRKKLWHNVAVALGSDFCERLDRRFDISYAKRNAALFWMADIPAPEKPRDSRITNMRFRVDLSSIVPSACRAMGPQVFKELVFG